jgi:hypothetical protein
LLVSVMDCIPVTKQLPEAQLAARTNTARQASCPPSRERERGPFTVGNAVADSPDHDADGLQQFEQFLLFGSRIVRLDGVRQGLLANG